MDYYLMKHTHEHNIHNRYTIECVLDYTYIVTAHSQESQITVISLCELTVLSKAVDSVCNTNVITYLLLFINELCVHLVISDLLAM